MKKHMTVFQFLAYFTLVSAFVVGCVVTYWLAYPYEPLTIHSVEVLTPTVKQGGTLVLRLNYTKTMDVEGVGTRTFVDGITFSTPTIKGRIPMAEKQDLLREVAIPDVLPPSVYYLHSVVVFEDVNPLRSITYDYDSPTFTVTPAVEHPDAEQDKE